MPISLQDFQSLLEIHGASLPSWPQPEQETAAELLRQSGEARSLLEEMQRMEEALRSAPPVKAPRGLAARIVQAARKTPQGET